MPAMGDKQYPLWRRAATHTLHTSILLKSILEDRLQDEVGILLADNEALLNIAEAEAPLRMSDLAERLILSRGGMTKVIDRIEDMGLVSRTPDPDDRRATVVEITPEGREMIIRARKVVDAALIEMWAEHITDEEATMLIDVMDRVIAGHRWKAH